MSCEHTEIVKPLIGSVLPTADNSFLTLLSSHCGDTERAVATSLDY